MKRTLILLLTVMAGLSLARADGPTVEAAIAVDENTKPTDTFTADTAQLIGFFHSTGTAKGDSLKGVWIAEDVGAAAPANTKIIESTLTADKDDFSGGFQVSKPNAGWPVGKYRFEIYSGDTLLTTVKFTITAAPSAQ